MVHLEVERRKNADAIAEEIAQTHLVFLNKDDFFDRIPGGQLIKAAYGENFWVQDLPLCGAMVYTDTGCKKFSNQKALHFSHQLHEPVHFALSETFVVHLRMQHDQQVELDANLVLPDWFKEGLANLTALRFAANVEGMTNFLDLFLDSWDGKIPSNKDLIAGDTNVSYFFYTVFTAFCLQTLMCSRSEVASEFSLENLGNFKQIMHAIGLLRNASHVVDFKLPDLPGDITQPYLEAMFSAAADFLSISYPDKYKNKINFDQICNLFDTHKDAYAKAWFDKFSTPSQKTKLKYHAVNQGKTMLPQNEKYSKPPSGTIDIGSQDIQLMIAVRDMYTLLAERPSEASRRVLAQIEASMELARYVPAKSFQRLLSEALMVIIANPEDDAQKRHIEKTQHNIKRQLFRLYWEQANPDVKRRVRERGVDVIHDVFKKGPLIGVFSADESFDEELAREILLRHFDMILGSRQKLFTDQSTPFEFSGRKSILELLSLASGISPEELFAVLASQNYVFMPVSRYHEILPYLKTVDSLAFLVREHPEGRTILYTDRAALFKGEKVLGGDNVRHESIGHMLQAVTLPMRVRYPDNPKIYELNSGLILRTWFHEGTANLISMRFIDNYRDFTDFWKLAIEKLGDPDKIVIPSSSEIVSADTTLPYIFHTLFSGFVLQMIGERFSHIASGGFPTAPNQFAMLQGYFMLLRTSNHIEPFVLSENPSQDLGQEYLMYLLEQTAIQYGISLPSFDEMCHAFDRYKDEYWKKWRSSFEPT
jgi:hypothetical protein